MGVVHDRVRILNIKLGGKMKIKMTKVVCTIGPKTESIEMLTKLVESGMNVMRLNFSHGDFEEHGARIKNKRT